MFNIIETALTLTLTALATFIAVAQFRNEQRAARREVLKRQQEDAEKTAIKKLIDSAKQAEKSVATFVRFKEALYGPQGEDRFNDTTIGAANCLEAYAATLANVSNLYERLLVNEETFPSRSLERYIDAFRSFLMTKETHGKACEAYASFKDWVRTIYQESSILQEKDVDEFNRRIDPIFDDLERLGEAIYKLYPYIEEISIKFSNKESN